MCDIRPQSVLLVEDSEDDMALALRALRRCERPLRVRAVVDGDGARRALRIVEETLRASGWVPDLILSDLKLPGLRGDELVGIVRAVPRLARVPYVVYSSSSEPDDIGRCLMAGADAYVQKPVGYDEYLECLGATVRWGLDGFGPAPSGLRRTTVMRASELRGAEAAASR